MYLGDGSLAKMRRGVWHLHISSDSRYPGTIGECVRYYFSNRSEDIKALLCESLDRLGISWTRPSDRQIAIYRKAAAELLDRFEGPKK